jgi:hypothetical protein
MVCRILLIQEALVVHLVLHCPEELYLGQSINKSAQSSILQPMALFLDSQHHQIFHLVHDQCIRRDHFLRNQVTDSLPLSSALVSQPPLSS